MEKGKSAGKKGEQDHACRPDVERGRLPRTLEQDFRSTETTCAGAIGTLARPRVVTGKGRHGRIIVVFQVLLVKVLHFLFTLVSWLPAQTRPPVGILSLRQPEINEHAARCGGPVQEIGWLDVAVYDAGLVHARQRAEETAHVQTHV